MGARPTLRGEEPTVMTSDAFSLVSTHCTECNREVQEFWPKSVLLTRQRRVRCYRCLAAEFPVRIHE